jgi:hypothetical protein
VPKFLHVPAETNLQGLIFFSNVTYFIDPISPVGPGVSNNAVCPARPLGSPRNLFQTFAEKPKIQVEKVRSRKYNFNPSSQEQKKHATNHKEKTVLSNPGPQFCTIRFSVQKVQ